jgi:hypothetical protein
LAGLLTAADIGEAMRLLTARPQVVAASGSRQPSVIEQAPF